MYPAAPAPAGAQGRDLPQPAQVHRRPGHARACSSCAASCSRNRVPDVPGGGTVAYVNPTEHRYLDDPVHREEGGTPAIVESIRAGLVFQLKEAVGVDDDPGPRGGAPAPRDRRRGTPSPAIEILGNLDAERLSIVSFVVAAPGGPLPAPQLRRRAAQRPVRHPVPRRLLVRRPVRPPAARHRPRALARVRARDHRRLRGHQARLGAGQLQLLHLRGRLPLRRRRGRPRRRATAGGCCRDYRFDPRHRAVAPPPRPGRAAAAPRRRHLRRRRRDELPPAHDDGPRLGAREHLDEGRAIMAAASPPDWSDTAHLGADFDDLRWFALPACSVG